MVLDQEFLLVNNVSLENNLKLIIFYSKNSKFFGMDEIILIKLDNFIFLFKYWIKSDKKHKIYNIHF